MDTTEKVNITLKLDPIDRENFKIKAQNSPYKKMQYVLENMVKQYLKEDSDVIIKETTKQD